MIVTSKREPDYLSFDDLKARGIVNNRMTLARWIETQNFPAATRLGPNSVRWRASRVEKWLAEREGAGAEA